MADKLTSELMEAVDKNLPQMVGDQLKARLVKADADAKEASKVPGLEAELSKAKDTIRANEQKVAAVTGREEKATQRELVVDLREKLMELKEKHAQERVQEMRGVVDSVFANSRFKYQETYNHYTPQGSHGGGRNIESSEVPGVPR